MRARYGQLTDAPPKALPHRDEQICALPLKTTHHHWLRSAGQLLRDIGADYQLPSMCGADFARLTAGERTVANLLMETLAWVEREMRS